MKRQPPMRSAATDTLTLPSGVVLTYGDEFTVKGTPQSDGRYSFRYGWGPEQATCYGPLGRKDQAIRTFNVLHITTVHRKKIERTES